MILAVPKETHPGEKRVALIPASLAALQKVGFKIQVETGAGEAAGHPDSAYQAKGAQIVTSRAELFGQAEVVAMVRTAGALADGGAADLARARSGQVWVAFMDPLSQREPIQALAKAGVTAFAMEMIPRTTKAQAMDALSSMASVAGYKAVLLAAAHHVRMFPMLMTAAGTVTPAKVFVVGAGVAGLQAIAMSRKLGAVVHAYDVRPAVKEQIMSLGAKFVEIALDTADSQDKGGYARAQDETFYTKQREMMLQVVSESDVVITTAAVPGKKAPLLVTSEMVQRMVPGSVIVDLAAERGGNCELTRADEIVQQYGVTILGPTNLPSTVPYHASQLYSKNVSNLLTYLMGKEGQLKLDLADEIVRGTMLCQNGAITNDALKPAAAQPVASNA